MKLSCLQFLSTTATAALLFVPSSKASDLNKKWEIGFPTAIRDGNLFYFNYATIDESYITNFNTQVQVTMYDTDCRVNGAETKYGQLGIITSSPNDTADTMAFDLLSLAYNNTGYDTTDGTGNMQYVFKMIPSEMAKLSAITSNITDDVSEMNFCVRLGFYLGTQEINFIESKVALGVIMKSDNFNLGDGPTDMDFDFPDFKLSPKETQGAGSFSATQEYKVDASLCPDQPTQFNQGAVIKVCLAPNGQALYDGVVLSSVDSFTWKRSIGVVGSASQSAVNEDISVDKNTEALDGLSVITVQDDQKQIMIETILYAAFYESSGTVLASGSATLAFPDDTVVRRNRNRRLVRDSDSDSDSDSSNNNNKQRNLQQQGAFDITVDVITADDGPVLLSQTAGDTGTFDTTIVIVVVAATIGIVISAIYMYIQKN